MKLVPGILVAAALNASAFAQPTATEIWRTDNVSRPEAVHVPANSDWAIIGNQGPENAEQGGYLSRLHLVTGEFQEYWASGYEGPLGIISSTDRVYFSDQGQRVIILDRQSGREIDRLEAPEDAALFNDLAIDGEGALWATDTRVGALFRYRDGVWSQVAAGEAFTGANGIEFVDGWIYVVCSSGVGNLVRVDPETYDYEVIFRGEGSLDGVVTDGRGGLILSDLNGRLLHWNEQLGLTVLDDFAGEEIMLNSSGGTPDGRFIFSPHWRQSQLSMHEVSYTSQAD